MARKRQMALVGEALQECLARMDAELPFHLTGVWRNWKRIVGEEAASMAMPLGRHKRTLIVGAEDHAAQQELTYYSPAILEAVNAYLGEECFDKMQVDLLMGETPLNESASQSGGPGGARTVFGPRPDRLGGLLGGMREDSPVARCYEAYVRHFVAASGGRRSEE